MYLVNLVLFEWVKLDTPQIQLWSFVDNLKTTGETPEETLDSLISIQSFCDALDIQQDTAKPFVGQQRQRQENTWGSQAKMLSTTPKT